MSSSAFTGGVSGTSGTSGSSSTSGSSGTTGTSGTSATSGSSGTSGGLGDGSVTYTKLASGLVSSVSSNTGAYDFSTSGIVIVALSTNTSITFTNLQLNKTLKMKLTISGGATITFPAYCIKMTGSQTLGDGTFYLYFDCWNATGGSELVIYSIMKSA